MARDREWWDRWFLGLAQYISTASKDPSTKVGAVIVDSFRRVVSVGYNGFPRGIFDDHRLEDRTKKYELMCHAESNALDFADRRSLANCTLYTWPVPPCPRCAGRIIQNGIVRVVAPYTPTDSEIGLRIQLQLSLEMLLEAGVTVHQYEETHAQKEQVSTDQGQEVPEGLDDQGLQRNDSQGDETKLRPPEQLTLDLDPVQETHEDAPGEEFSGMYDYWLGLQQKSSCGGC